jgi:hypothetical protein
MAAIKACGGDAVLSHRSAAALWGIADEQRRWAETSPGCWTSYLQIEISIAGCAEPRRRGVRVRTRAALCSERLTTHKDISVTGIVQTLVDLGTALPANRLERAINEADKRELIDPEALRRALEGYAGEPGIRLLLSVLDRHTFLLSDGALELLFHPLAREAGLPLPRSKEMVNDFEVDFYWPALGLVVETDGWRYHRTPSAQTRDALRFQLHTASGLTPLRFSHWQVKHEPAHVIEILRRTASRLRRQKSA